MEAVALLIIVLVLCLAVIGFFLPFTEDAPKWADTDNDSDYTSEVAKNAQQSNLGEL